MSQPPAFWGSPQPDAPTPWLWQGFLAPGKITLLTALWKSGKTTLLAHLLARRQQGGPFLGLSVAPGVSFVASEEDPSLWAMRLRSLDLARVCFSCRPFAGRPTPDQLHDFASHILQLKDQHNLDLVVFDTLACFLPTPDENSAGLVLSALAPFSRLAAEGLAVLLLHHPKKGDAPLGQAARGSGALLAAVDVFLEMRHPGGDPFTRRRRLFAWSRFPETPRRLLIELAPDSSGYTLLPDTDDDFHSHWDALHPLLAAAEAPLTRNQILQSWPPDLLPPSEVSLWKWLNRALHLGLALRLGKGTRTDPFRFCLPQTEDLPA